MQRFNILDPTLNVLSHRFLEASAGTGKTFTIEHLFVRWISEGIAIKEILVVTFTKAATQELSQRIHQRLQKMLVVMEDLEKKLRIEAALACYDEARIFTIHGFCQTMLRQNFLQSRCTLLFSESQEVHGAALWKEWIDFLRAHIDLNVCSRIQIELYFGNEFEKNLRALINMWKPNIVDPLPPFYQVVAMIEEDLKTLGSYPASLVLEDFEKLQDVYTKFTNYQEQYHILSRWCECGTVSTREIESLLGHEEFFLEALKKAEKRKKQKTISWNFPELVGRLQGIFTPLFNDLKNRKKIAQKLCSQFTAHRQRYGQSAATPDELLMAMDNALDNEEFLKNVQGQFSAAVIDEFQDTDAVQWRIFSRLFMRQRALKAFYLVGDPKQAIYSFRQADLYTYLQAKEAFQSEEMATLSVNYRSEHALVAALNALFTDEQRKGWMRLPRTGQSLDIPKVEAFDCVKRDPIAIGNVHVVVAHQGEEQLFAYIASQIQFWSGYGVLPKEIAILVKDRFEARRLIRFLSRFKIQAHYTSQGHLADTATFEAVADFFGLLEKPRDRASLKKVLAGPLVSWPQEYFTEERVTQAVFGVQRLLTIFQEKGLGACLRSFFEEAWSGSDRIVDKLLRNDALERHEEYEQLCEVLLQKNGGEQWNLMQIRLFLDALRKEKNKENAEFEKRSSLNDNAVEITTIFQSKGLEYMIVFPLALATSEQKEEDEESAAETMRLLYVALTRAKRCVYLPWMKRKKKTIADQFLAHWDAAGDIDTILDKVAQLGKEYAITLEKLTQERIEVAAFKQKVEIVKSLPKPTEFTRRYVKRQITSFSSMTKGNEHVLDIKPAQETLPIGKETGLFVHALFENIFQSSWHHPYQKEKIAEWIKKQAEGTLFSTLNKELALLAEQVLHLEIEPLCFGKKAFILAEVPEGSLMPEMEFTYAQGNNLLHGFIDLALVHEGQYYIIDWKTNWLPEYSLEQMEESIERNQYRLQAKIYTEALKRHVKIFDNRDFGECFGGAYYLYLRGMQWKSFKP
ncbi:MAG: UvrD-helicase domain-containing protein [Simkania sp.]|nr:UvrD-helicase domain-containing protein [Simkania sp.]